MGRKFPKFTHIHITQFCKSSPKATIAWSIAWRILIYDKQTQFHQRNQNQIEANLKTNIHVIMVKSEIYKMFPTLPPGFDFSSTNLDQPLPCHPRPCQSEQLLCWPPALMLTRLTSRDLTSGDFEIMRRSYQIWNFAKQLQNEHHHHQSFTLII